MGVTVRSFWLPRLGHKPDEYEDAFAAEPSTGRYAIADGAGEGAFTGLWARLLVDGFAHAPNPDLARWPDALAGVQAEWNGAMHGRPLPWYGQEQVAEGAFATFLGLIVEHANDATHRWQAVSVGDCCLFHTRGPTLLTAFPIGNSGEFGNAPRLVGSRMPAEQAAARVCHAEGFACPDDRLWLMTDALAHWCLASHEAGADPWQAMEPLLAPEATVDSFRLWVDDLHATGRLRNDDVTLMVLQIR